MQQTNFINFLETIFCFQELANHASPKISDIDYRGYYIYSLGNSNIFFI